MKLALLSEASQHWRQIQERGFEGNAGAAASTVMQSVTRTLAARDSETTCKPNDTSDACQKPVAGSHTQTIAIALGAGIPLICAAFVLVYLHQRHVRKQRIEDKNDPHKSLDFGMEGVGGKQESKWAKQRKGPEMSVTDLDGSKTGRKDRGLSLDDMGLGNPYLLPGELAGSGGSIHSMSRSLHDDHDPYRPVTFIKDGDNGSIRSRAYNEKGSIYSGVTSVHSTERAGLVANASRMSQSFPKRGDSKLSGEPLSPQDSISSDASLARTMHSQNNGATGRKPVPQPEPALANITETSPRINVHSPPPPPEKELTSPPPRTSSAAVDKSGPAARKGSLPHIAIPPRMSTQSSDYGDIEVDEIDAAPQPQRRVPSLMVEEPDRQAQRMSVQGLNLAQPSMPNNRLSVMGVRPLPPTGPEDNPETRANRIRSFYKEYFDDSKPEPAGAQYQDTYDLDYLTDAAIYDPDTGGFAMAARPGRAANTPFAEPLGRRAMTPPPRGARTPVPGPHRRQMSTQTVGRYGPPRGPVAPKKVLPPPMPLKSLPTPGMLKDDTAIFNADDFAPPVSYRDRQAGRALDSPTGSLRPYSPSVASHVPLAPSMAELSPMPSPFQMRKSGTFTALDFAPPSRVRAPGDGMSDAGSIRSARSGISHMHSDALRAGAYRVSRLPPEMVTTRDDLAAQLKPSWDMRKDTTMG